MGIKLTVLSFIKVKILYNSSNIFLELNLMEILTEFYLFDILTLSLVFRFNG